MGKDLKKALDEVAHEERIRIYGAALIVAGGFFLFILMMLLFFPGNISTFQGAAVRLTANLTYEGNYPIMMVRLNSGEIVRASMSRSLPFKEGAVVDLVLSESITGQKSYSVNGYKKSTHKQ